MDEPGSNPPPPHIIGERSRPQSDQLIEICIIDTFQYWWLPQTFPTFFVRRFFLTKLAQFPYFSYLIFITHLVPREEGRASNKMTRNLASQCFLNIGHFNWLVKMIDVLTSMFENPSSRPAFGFGPSRTWDVGFFLLAQQDPLTHSSGNKFFSPNWFQCCRITNNSSSDSFYNDWYLGRRYQDHRPAKNFGM